MYWSKSMKRIFTSTLNFVRSFFKTPSLETIQKNHTKPTNKCVILVPCNSSIENKTDESLRILESRGYEVWRVTGWSCISQGRSKIIYDAVYRRGFEEVLWIDSDVSFHPDDVEKIRSHNLPIVGASYPMKGWPIMTVAPLNKKRIIFDQKRGGLVEVKALATGFLFIKSEVFHRMKEKLNLPVCNTSFSAETIPFFKPEIWVENGNSYFLGEDFSFCYNASKCGYKIMLDSSIKLGHVGKYVYEWGDVINKTGKLPKPNSSKPLVYKDINVGSSTSIVRRFGS